MQRSRLTACILISSKVDAIFFCHRFNYTVERLSGKNRYETAVAINEEAETTNNSESNLVNGLTVTDGLSAFSNSALNGAPLYLPTKDKFTANLPSNGKVIQVMDHLLTVTVTVLDVNSI
ncbi:hypothetical protein GLV97_14660 [Halobacillus litoralis]|nr:hypothetical protein [Halobacillus litoralis]